MRHQKRFNHLGRKTAHRKAMLANMASSLIKHKRINTTVAKAKALRMYVEPLITKSREDSTHSRRVVFSYLKDKYAVSELFREVAVKIANRPGGYTRILKTGNRLGDNAEMCIIELVDYNENMLTTVKTKEKPSRRRRGRKKNTEGEVTTAVETQVAEVQDVAEETGEDKADDAVTEIPVEKGEEETPADTAGEIKDTTVEEKIVETEEDIAEPVKDEVTDSGEEKPEEKKEQEEPPDEEKKPH